MLGEILSDGLASVNSMAMLTNGQLQKQKGEQNENLFFYLALHLGILLVGPTLADEIHKHDGSILTGKIIEIIPNELYKIQLAGGSILVINPEEVKEIVISSTKTTETETPTPSIDVSNSPYKRCHIGIQAGFQHPVTTPFSQLT